MVERLYCLSRLFGGFLADNRHKHFRMGKVTTDFHIGHCHHADTGIPHFLLDQQRKIAAEVIRHALGPAELASQRRLPLFDGALHHLPVIHFNLVARADVVVILHANTALGAAAHFIDIILEAAQ